MATGLEPAVDTFAELTAGNTDGPFAATWWTTTLTGIRRGPIPIGWTPTELIGMGIGDVPALSMPEQAMPGLRSVFHPNGAG